MTKRSWQLNRRTFLRGTGVALALPMFDRMASETAQQNARHGWRVFYGCGVRLPPKREAHQKWYWFPHGEGSDYRLTDIAATREFPW